MATLIGFLKESGDRPVGVLIRDRRGVTVFDDKFEEFLKSSLVFEQLNDFNLEMFASDDGKPETWLTANMESNTILEDVTYYGKMEAGTHKLKGCRRIMELEAVYGMVDDEDSTIVGYDVIIKAPMGSKWIPCDHIYIPVNSMGLTFIMTDEGLIGSFRLQIIGNDHIIVVWER